MNSLLGVSVHRTFIYFNKIIAISILFYLQLSLQDWIEMELEISSPDDSFDTDIDRLATRCL